MDRTDEVVTTGADEVLTKPISLAILENTVRRLLRQGISADRVRGRMEVAWPVSKGPP